jgi:hypothetical protein
MVLGASLRFGPKKKRRSPAFAARPSIGARIPRISALILVIALVWAHHQFVDEDALSMG